MKNLILTFVFALVSLVSFTQRVSVNDSIIDDNDFSTNTDTVNITVSLNDSVVFKNIYNNTWNAKYFATKQNLVGDIDGTNIFTNNTDSTFSIKKNDINTNTTKYVRVNLPGSSYKLYVIITFENPSTASLFKNELTVNELKVYPNPATTDVKISFESNTDNVEVVVVNTSGQIVYSNSENKAFGTNTLEVNVSDWQKGMYFVKIGNNTQKLVVE